jgi:chromosome transmission fidelity protein 4
VWDVASGTLVRDVGKVAPNVARDAEWHAYNRVAWAPDGSRLACPGRNNDVVLFSRDDDWAEAARLKEAHCGDVSLLAMSPNGLYCATAGMDMSVVVWDLRKCVSVATAKLPDAATGLAWRAAGGSGEESPNALAVLTYEGTAAVWEAPVSARLPPPAALLESIDLSEFEAPTAGGFVDDSAVDAAGGDDDDEDGGDGGEDGSSGGDASGSEGGEGEEGGDGGRRRRGPRRERIVYVPAAPAPQAAPQGAVSSGATPAMGAPPRRFLAYNTLGCVTCRDDGGVQHIEVHFHDLERPGPRVPSHTDYLGVTLGALGPAGVAYASPEKGESASTLMFRPFEGWSANAEWTLPFPAGESAEVLAAGGSFVAAATSARLVRVLTPMGVQMAVFALDGAPVALAAQGSMLAVAWHASHPVGPPPGEQRLSYAIYDTDSGARAAEGALPLTPGETLTWLSFSEEGLLACADSAGVVRLRSGAFGGSWTPVFSSAAARSGEAERHWVVGVTSVEVYAVVVKAPDAAPAVAPRPVLSLFPLCVPILGAAAPAAGTSGPAPPSLEEALLRARMWAGDAVRLHGAGSQPAAAAELELNKTLLKLFNAALKADRLGRAAELASHMTHAPCLEGALKMANAARAVALAERITSIIHGRVALEMELGGEELVAEYPSQAIVGSFAAPRGGHAQEAPATKFARRPAAAAPVHAEAAPAPAGRAGGAENDSPPGGRKRDAGKAAAAADAAPPPKRPAATLPAAANPFARK